MLGKVVMSKLGVIGSPLVITLASATLEVSEINFWDLLAVIFRTWSKVPRIRQGIMKNLVVWRIRQGIAKNSVTWHCICTRDIPRIRWGVTKKLATWHCSRDRDLGKTGRSPESWPVQRKTWSKSCCHRGWEVTKYSVAPCPCCVECKVVQWRSSRCWCPLVSPDEIALNWHGSKPYQASNVMQSLAEGPPPHQ